MPNHIRNRNYIIVFVTFLFLATSCKLFPNIAYASLTGCQANLTPESLNTSTNGTLTFRLLNSDSNGNPLKWIKISAPSSNFVITSAGGTYTTGTSVATDGSNVIIRLSGLAAGESADYEIGVTTGASAADAAAFTLQASDTTEGDSPIICSVNGTVAIISGGQGGVNISNLTISVSSTTAIISWNTSANATGSVNYGTTSGYGSSASDTNSSTSHSVTLSGLTPSTTYHYQVTSTNGSDSALSSDNTFTTAAAGTTTTTVTTVTTTTTVTAAVVKDITAPSVSITTDFNEPFAVAPEITGKASDTSRIVKVEYSIDGGSNWIYAEALDLGEKSTVFNFVPDLTEDGNYKIVVRALDGAGNTGKSKTYNLIIDRLPPLIGGNIWSIGPIPVLPNLNGVITVLAGVDHKITMSAVGGPTSIDLIINGTIYPMTKSVDSGLWSGIVNFVSPGHYVVKVKSIDGANNETVRDLNSILVIDSGKIKEKGTDTIIREANINICQQDELSKVWSLWDGQSFGQENPQVITDGSYSYFLPSGTYYLTSTVSGYKKVTSKIFKIKTPTTLNTNIEMERGWWVNPFKSINMSVIRSKVIANEQEYNSLIGKEAPRFLLPSITGQELDLVSLRGKNRMLVFLNTWLPATSEQISVISALEKIYKDRISIIMIEENISKVSVFAKKGGYNDLSIVADPDGTLVDSYYVNSLPSSYFIDRKGLVQKMITGVVLGDEIINNLDF